MSFKKLEDFFDASITLPILGKEYTIQSPDAETGLLCQRLVAGAAKVMAGGEISEADTEKLRLDDEEEQELYKRLMGAAWDEMIADHVPWTLIKHAGTTVLVWVTQSRDDAESFWSAGPNPKKPEQPQDHQPPATKKAATSRGSSTRKRSGNPTKRAVTAGTSSSTTGH